MMDRSCAPMLDKYVITTLFVKDKEITVYNINTLI